MPILHRFELLHRATVATCTFLLFGLLSASPALGQSTGEGPGTFGNFSFQARISGSYNELGAVTKLESAIGYELNDHFGVTVGVPFYFVSSSTTLADSETKARNGIGNVFLDLRATVHKPALNFASTLTVTAPTGDRESGFSTGRATFDWNNLFFRTFSRFTPYANVGVANTISDTPFFVRPFSTLGLVGHLETGVQYRLSRSWRLGASAYQIIPSGEQKVFSRLVRREPPGTPPTSPGASRFNRRRAFETAPTTAGDAEIARDRGFSTWVGFRPASALNLSVGYSRSTFFSLDSLFFGVGLELRSVFQRPRSRMSRSSLSVPELQRIQGGT